MSQGTSHTAAALEFADVTATYAGTSSSALEHASATVPAGAFCLMVGATGAGKTTALRLAKPELSGSCTYEGHVRVFGQDVADWDVATSAQTVGYVGQDPATQIVCDEVWRELAFGLENLGTPSPEIRRRVAQMCYFLGLDDIFRSPCAALSGGQRQLVALAATAVMEPRLLILDEPTSMLDPLARATFAHALFRLNRELGVTVVVATHEPATLASYATCALEVRDKSIAPVALDDIATEPALDIAAPAATPSAPAIAELREAWSRYDRDSGWVLAGCSYAARPGIRGVVGSNGCGKSTLLRALAGTQKLQRGRLTTCDRKLSQALLPQEVEALLGQVTVRAELEGDPDDVERVVEALGIAHLMDRDPLALSGGQRQLVGLAKSLVAQPRLLLLDEPTLGLDRCARERVGRALVDLSSRSAIVITSHDLPFVEAVASECAMMFDGTIACEQPAADFFAASVFYR